MTEHTDSDILAQDGQNEFSNIVGRKGLRALPSTRDIEGIDHRVVWLTPGSPDLSENETYDTKKPPLRVNVQIKSTETNPAEISIKLSAIKHLVDINDPAFIVIMVYDQGVYQSMSIFHVDESLIDRILKKLRRCQLQGQKPHKRYLKLRAAQGQQVSDPDIRAYFEKICGEDIDEYARWKIAYRESSGYNDDRFTTHMILRADSEQELFAGFAGRGELQVISQTYFETRFGVALKSTSPFGEALETITITPTPLQNWKLSIIKNDDLLVSVWGNVSSPWVPGMPEKYRMLNWSSELVDIEMGDERFQINLDTQAVLNVPNLPSFIHDNLNFVSSLLGGGTALQASTPKNDPAFTLPFLEIVDPVTEFDSGFYMTIIDSIHSIWEKSGQKPYPITLGELPTQDIYMAGALTNAELFKRAEAGTVLFKKEGNPDMTQLQDPSTIAYATTVCVGDQRFALISICETELVDAGDELGFKLTDLKKSTVRCLRPGQEEEGFDRFFDEQNENFDADIWAKIYEPSEGN